MTTSYEQLLAAVRDHTAWVCIDVQAPRDAQVKQLVASLFAPTPEGQRTERPQGQAFSLPVTLEQGRELLVAGADWKAPAHLRAEVFPDL